MAELNGFSSFLEDLRNFDINDIDWSQMGSWPLVAKVIFCSLVMIVIFALGFFVLIQGERKSLQVEEKREVSLKKDFKNKAYRVANIDQYKEQMNEMELTFGSLLKQLPQETEIPEIIDDVTAAALRAGLTLKTMDPKELVETEFYNELPIQIEVIGDYHAFGAFVSGVAAMPRIVTLHDFHVRTRNQEQALAMSILAKTYQYSVDDSGE